MSMSREAKLKAIADNFVANAEDFDNLTDEQESKIMDGVLTILEKSK